MQDLTPSYQRLLSIVIIVLLSAGIYLNSLNNQFLYDDKALVINNELIKDVNNIPAFFIRDIWPEVGEGVSNYFRPLIYVIFTINYFLTGLEPWLFHAVNILFNTGCALTLFFIVLNLSEDKKNFFLPFSSAILFAAHPVHTEAVSWVSGLPDISSTFFFLLAFLFFMKSERTLRGKHLLSAFFFFTALLCKEPAIMLPAVLVVYDFYFSKKKGKAPAYYLQRYSPYALAVFFYLILRSNAISGFTPNVKHSGLTFYELLLNILTLFASYLKKLLLPSNLSVYYVFHPAKSFLETAVPVSAIVAIFYFILVFYLKKRRPLISFSLLWIVLTILPSLYIPALGENVFAERYLYLPSAGFSIIAAFATGAISSFRFTKNKFISVSLILLIIVEVAYCAKTVQRNFVWKNEMALWSDTVKKSPDGAIPHSNYAIVLRKAGRIDEAIAHYKEAINLRPDYFDAHYNLGVAYHLEGNLKDAEKEYRKALSLNPRSFSAHNNLGSLLRDKGLYDDAIREYRKALKLNPSLEMTKRNLRKTRMLAQKRAEDK